MSATIKVFQVGEKRFTHFMNSMNDSVQLRDEGNETLLTYGPGARVSNQRGRWGSFFDRICQRPAVLGLLRDAQ